MQQNFKTGGKILVVSFHSIEDKIVKFFFSAIFLKINLDHQDICLKTIIKIFIYLKIIKINYLNLLKMKLSKIILPDLQN